MSGSTSLSGSGQAIPAGQIVSVVPSVLNAGGTGLDLNGLLITMDNHIPIGQVLTFTSLLQVQNFFGATSYMSALAQVYFLADIGATKKPGALLVACYSWQWLPAWVMSAQMPSLTLAQVNALQNSQFSITMGGRARTTSVISLATATSFSDAAFRIGAGIHNTDATDNTTNPEWSGQTGAYVGQMQVTQSGFTMTVTSNTAPTLPPNGAALAKNPILPGDLIKDGTTFPPDTYVIARLTSADNGLTGTFQMSHSLNITTPITVKMYRNPCSWDSVTSQFKIATQSANYKLNQIATIGPITSLSGNLVAGLKLAPAYGSTIQPMGTSNNSPASGYTMLNNGAFMTQILKVTQDWATFALAFECDGLVGGQIQNTNKQAFASWANGQGNNYMFCCWENDANAAGTPGSAAAQSTLGRILNTSLSSGTAVIYSPTVTNGRNLAVFTMGVVAGIDFARPNGRKTLAFRGQTGMTPDITDGNTASNLEGNFYNYYGIWTTANDLFRFMYPGTVSGPWQWIDSYVNQIWMNNGFQEALMNLLTQTGSIPYNHAGYTLIKAACQDVIDAALSFGAIRAGVTLSEAQRVEVNNQAGVQIDGILNAVGYYLQVLDASPQVRQARGTPPCMFWYMDGGSVQRITLASVMVQ